MPDSLSDDYSFKKMSDSASNSSGSKQAGNNFNRQNVKVDAFDDKPPMLTASSPNYYEYLCIYSEPNDKTVTNSPKNRMNKL